MQATIAVIKAINITPFKPLKIVNLAKGFRPMDIMVPNIEA